MEVNQEAVKSRIKISNDVIITIARLAALDVKGVAGLSGEVNSMSKLRKNGPISIGMIGDVVSIGVRIIVKNGEKACTVAQEVQDAVKENVQNMTGLAVAQVNVTVSGVTFDT